MNFSIYRPPDNFVYDFLISVFSSLYLWCCPYIYCLHVKGVLNEDSGDLEIENWKIMDFYGSVSVFRAFAHNLRQHPVISGAMAKMAAKDVVIHNVWRQNLDEEFAKIRRLVKDYPFVAFDTEFPGVVATPMGAFKNKEEFQYNQISCNVNMLKLIQVGFCLTNSRGELPPGGDIWQFNFHFSVSEDMYAVESVDLLKKSGIDFERHRVGLLSKFWSILLSFHISIVTLFGFAKLSLNFDAFVHLLSFVFQTHGIRLEDFGALLTTSGLVVNGDVTWLTFHSCFDFGYLIKTIVVRNLPATEKEFFEIHRTLFPCSYDIKMLMKLPGVMAAKLRGGLQDVADQLCVERIGSQHQAGSDSLLTARTFFRLKEKFFGENWDKVCFCRLLGFYFCREEFPNDLCSFGDLYNSLSDCPGLARTYVRTRQFDDCFIRPIRFTCTSIDLCK